MQKSRVRVQANVVVEVRDIEIIFRLGQVALSVCHFVISYLINGTVANTF